MDTSDWAIRIRALTRVTTIMLFAFSVSGCAWKPPRLSMTASHKLIPPDATSAQFKAIVFEIRIPDDRIAAFDAQSINRQAKTAEEFQNALKEYGDTKMLYNVDQTISLKGKDSITLGNEVPIVTNSRTTMGGQTINSIEYVEVGALFTINEQSETTSPISRYKVDVELSVLSDSSTQISPQRTGKNFRRTVMSFDGIGYFGKPYVTASIDSAIKDKDGTSAAFVCRVVLSANE